MIISSPFLAVRVPTDTKELSEFTQHAMSVSEGLKDSHCGVLKIQFIKNNMLLNIEMSYQNKTTHYFHSVLQKRDAYEQPLYVLPSKIDLCIAQRMKWSS